MADIYLKTELKDMPRQRWFKRTFAAAMILMLFAPAGWGADEEIAALQGIVEPRSAPGWDISEWLNSDPGSVESLSLIHI